MSIGELGGYQISGKNNENTSMLSQSGSVEKTGTGEKQSIQRPRRASTGSRNSVAQPPSEQMGFKPVCTGEQSSKKPSYIFVQARSETGEIVGAEKLEELLNKREEEYQKEFAEHADLIFDFSQKRELQEKLEQAEKIAKSYFAKTRSGFGLPVGEIDLLHPIYVQKKEGDGGGYWGWNGLFLTSVYEESPLLTAISAAQGISCLSSDTIYEDRVGQTEPVTINGLLRVYSETEREGELLNLGLVGLQTAEIYKEFKTNGLFSEEIAQYEKRFHEAVDEIPDKLAYGWDRFYADLHRAIKWGVPEDLIVASPLSIEAAIVTWRVERLIGKSLITDSSQPTDTQALVEMGRKVLEESKYFGIRKAHEIVEQILGPDAEIILRSDGNPGSYKKVHAALLQVEEREGLVSVNQEIRDAVRAIPFQVRDAATGQILEAETRAELLEKEELFEILLANLSLYDFSNEKALHDQLTQADDIINAYFLEKRSRYDLQDSDLQLIRAFYVDDTKEDADGYVDSIGFVVVMVDKNNPLETVLTKVHEISHASGGAIHETNTEQTELVYIYGLHRATKTEQEGGMLDNGLAVWHTADIYQRLKESGLFNRDTMDREWLFQVYKKLNYNVALTRALASGVPENLLEAITHRSQQIDEMNVTWRLAGLIGKSLITDPSQKTNIQALAERGREVLERSKYMGTREAHKHIERIFGEDARLFLTDIEHPENFEEMYAALQKAEKRAGIGSL